MATITSTGIGSGLDVNSIVTQLMALEKQPLTLLQNKATTLQTKLSAFGTLQSQISSVGDMATRLATTSNWNPLQATSTDSSSVSATAANTAAPGKYRLEVQNLAQPQLLASGPYASAGAFVGTGSLTLEIGTTAAGVFTPASGNTPRTITIGSANQTLAGVRDAINAAATGVTASIVTSGGSSRLVLNGADGAAGTVRLSATDDDGNDTDTAGLSAIAFDPAAAVGTGQNLGQTQAAKDANYTLNGLALTSASNSPGEVVQGLTLSLSRVTTAPVDVTVAAQTVAVRKNVNDFVNAYNSLNTLLTQDTLVDPGGSGNGPLQSDSTAASVMSSLRDLLHGTVAGMASSASLSAAGIELQRDGSLLVNDAKLTPLLSTPATLAQLFSQPQAGTDLNSRGIAVRFKQWANTLAGSTGMLSARTDGLNRSIADNQKQQDAQNDKMTRTEARLRAQYQALDSSMSSLNSQLAQMKSALGLT